MAPAETTIFQSLLAIAPELRDAAWYRDFESALMACHVEKPDPLNPKFFDGPDGLQYWPMVPLASGQGIAFKTVLPQLAEMGCGIVLQSGTTGQNYVMHYGDVWSMQEYGFFFKLHDAAAAAPMPSNDSNRLNLFQVPKSARIIIGCPSDHYFPIYVRKSIAAGLQNFGLQKIGVASVYIRDLNPRQNLVFSIKSADFTNPQDYQRAMDYLAWALPKHYGLLWNEIEDEKRPFLVGDADFYALV